MAGTGFKTGGRAINRLPIHGRADVRVTALADRGWVVVWQSVHPDGSGAELRQRRFNPSGQALDRADMVIGAPSSGSHRAHALAALPGGGWIVVWHGEGPAGESLGYFGRSFDENGVSREAADILISPPHPGRRSAPMVTPLHAGGWVVTWGAEVEDGASLRVLQRAYGASGNPLTPGETLVNSITAGWQFDFSVAALTDGGWIVVWEAFEGEGSQPGVYQQRFTPDGRAASPAEIAVSHDSLAWQFDPSVTALHGGGWVVGWEALDPDHVNLSLFHRCYTPQGVARPATEGRVNTTPLGWRFRPLVTPLPDGGWETTWISESRNGASWGVFQRRYDGHGAPQRLAGHLSEAAPDVQQRPECTRLDENALLLTWTSEERHGARFGIWQRRYDLRALHDGPTDSLVAVSTQGWHGRPWTIALAEGRCLVVWAEKTPDGAGCTLFQQIFDAGAAMLPAEGKSVGDARSSNGQGGPILSAATAVESGIALSARAPRRL